MSARRPDEANLAIANVVAAALRLFDSEASQTSRAYQHMNFATIVQKLWNYCNVLRDDGMSYVEQLSAVPPQDGRRALAATV